MKEISVVYQDGMMGAVESQVLQELIERDEIVKFHRSEGWVYPGVDPIRGVADGSYQGPDRRLNHVSVAM
jgi:hypothetical protein